MHFGGMYRFTQ